MDNKQNICGEGGASMRKCRKSGIWSIILFPGAPYPSPALEALNEIAVCSVSFERIVLPWSAKQIDRQNCGQQLSVGHVSTFGKQPQELNQESYFFFGIVSYPLQIITECC